MILSLYILAPLIGLWLALPLLMRPAFGAAGLAPMPAATTVLALVMCAVVVWLPGSGGDYDVPIPAQAAGFDDSHIVVMHGQRLSLLVFAALGLAGLGMVAAGLVQSPHPTLGTRLRQVVVGFGAYGVHVGAGALALLATAPLFALTDGQTDPAVAMALQGALEQGAAAVFLTGAVLVVASAFLGLILRPKRG